MNAPKRSEIRVREGTATGLVVGAERLPDRAGPGDELGFGGGKSVGGGEEGLFGDQEGASGDRGPLDREGGVLHQGALPEEEFDPRKHGDWPGAHHGHEDQRACLRGWWRL